MLGILKGKIKEAPEVRPTKNGGSFVSFTVSESIEGMRFDYSRKCFMWDTDNLDSVRDLNIGDEVEVQGEVRGSVFEKDGKHLVTLTLNVTSVKKLGESTQKSDSEKHNYYKEIEMSVMESGVEDLPF